MKASELIGKKVLRSKPVPLGIDPFSGQRNQDFSFTDGMPITIIKVTDSHIVYTSAIMGEERTNTLGERWMDDNWIDYDELMAVGPRDVTPSQPKIPYKQNN